jgi:hypothetical protein
MATQAASAITLTNLSTFPRTNSLYPTNYFVVVQVINESNTVRLVPVNSVETNFFLNSILAGATTAGDITSTNVTTKTLVVSPPISFSTNAILVQAGAGGIAAAVELRVGFSAADGYPMGYIGSQLPRTISDSAMTFGIRSADVVAEAMRLSDDGLTIGTAINAASRFNVAGGATVTGGLNVGGQDHKRYIYCVGDSLTAFGWYEEKLQALLGTNYIVVTLGAPGGLTSNMLNTINSDVLRWNNGSWLVVWCGINDVVHDETVATITTNLQTAYNFGFTNGLGVIALNLSQWGANALWTAGRQTLLNGVNDWIAASAARVNYKVDVNTALRDPASTNVLLAKFDSGDGLHLTIDGYYCVATNINSVADFSTVNNSTKALYVNGGGSFDAVYFPSNGLSLATIKAGITNGGAVMVMLSNVVQIVSMSNGVASFKILNP